MDKKQKGCLLLLVFVLTPLAAWTSLGFPMDNISLGAMTSSVIGGVISFTLVMLKGDSTKKEKKARSLSKDKR